MMRRLSASFRWWSWLLSGFIIPLVGVYEFPMVLESQRHVVHNAIETYSDGYRDASERAGLNITLSDGKTQPDTVVQIGDCRDTSHLGGGRSWRSDASNREQH